jgi:hypothetical protein
MIGVEPEMSGMASFQATFVDVFHEIGRFFSEEMPSRLGPRQVGQLPAGISEHRRRP